MIHLVLRGRWLARRSMRRARRPLFLQKPDDDRLAVERLLSASRFMGPVADKIASLMGPPYRQPHGATVSPASWGHRIASLMGPPYRQPHGATPHGGSLVFGQGHGGRQIARVMGPPGLWRVDPERDDRRQGHGSFRRPRGARLGLCRFLVGQGREELVRRALATIFSLRFYRGLNTAPSELRCWVASAPSGFFLGAASQRRAGTGA
jgi:hypothetical protein